MMGKEGDSRSYVTPSGVRDFNLTTHPQSGTRGLGVSGHDGTRIERKGEGPTTSGTRVVLSVEGGPIVPYSTDRLPPGGPFRTLPCPSSG